MLRDIAVERGIKKICVIGPECTGKTDLSKFLASHFNTVWVAEYARAYLERLLQPYEQSDLVKIAHGQVRMEDEWLIDANQLLICDTNALVIKVWSEFKYGNCDPEILKLIKERTHDLFLLTYVDIPWQEDPLREHPEKREELYNIYLEEMKKQSVPFVEIKGEMQQRRKTATDAIQQFVLDT